MTPNKSFNEILDTIIPQVNEAISKEILQERAACAEIAWAEYNRLLDAPGAVGYQAALRIARKIDQRGGL